MRIELYTIGIDFDGNIAESLTKIDKRAKDVAKNVSRRFDGLGRNIQKSLEKIRLPALAVTGAGVLAFKSLTAGASDLEESTNAVNVVFGEASNSILRFSKDADKAVGLSQKSFNQLSISTGALLRDTGLSSDELSQTTIELTKRAADLASVFNTEVDDALSAINQALRGETEAIRRYAGDVTDATLQTFLNSKGIQQNVKDLTQQEKRLFRVKLIMDQTAVAQDDFAKTIDSVANSQRVQRAQMENTADTLGKRLLPVMQSILRVTSKITTAFSSLSPETQDLIVKIGLAVTAISALLFVVSFAVPAFINLKIAILAIRKALIAVFITNPVTAIIAGIALVVWDLWKAFNGGDSVLKDLFDWFVNKFPEAAKVIIDTFKGISDAISNFFDGTQRLIRDTIDLAEGKITGKQFLFGEGGLEGLKNAQFGAPTFGDRPTAAAASTQTTTNTTQIDINSVAVNADNGEQFIESIQNVATGSILPAGVPQ